MIDTLRNRSEDAMFLKDIVGSNEGVISPASPLQSPDKKYFFDFDPIANNVTLARGAVNWFTHNLDQARRDSKIDVLMFIHRERGGPVGAISMAAAITMRSGIPNLIFRPAREIPSQRIKFRTAPSVNLPFSERFRHGGQPRNFAVLTDYCGEGDEAMDAVEAIEDSGGSVSDLLAFFVRGDKFKLEKFKSHGVNVRAFASVPEDLEQFGYH